MLSITTKSPYALRALAELARSGGDGPVPIGELARRRDIPVQFLEQLFAVLRRAGVLRIPARREGRLLVRPRARPRSRCSRSSSCSTASSARARGDLRRGRRGRPRRAGGLDDRRHRRAREPRRRRDDVLHLKAPPWHGRVWPSRAESTAGEPLSTAGIGGRTATRLLRTRHVGSRGLAMPPEAPALSPGGQRQAHGFLTRPADTPLARAEQERRERRVSTVLQPGECESAAAAPLWVARRPGRSSRRYRHLASRS